MTSDVSLEALISIGRTALTKRKGQSLAKEIELVEASKRKRQADINLLAGDCYIFHILSLIIFNGISTNVSVLT